MNSAHTEKLFTIAIPTYNRASYLELCLAQIGRQICGYEQFVELIVSDNASPDNTQRIVQKHILGGLQIAYVRNDVNIGADGNIAQAFKLAKGTYVLVLSDDDVLVPGALKKIVEVLRTGVYGVVHLQAYPYQSDFEKEFPRKNRRPQTFVYDNLAQFIKRVNCYFTFISGNIVNKTLVDAELNIDEFCRTNLVQLSWTFSALFNSNQNVYIGQNLIAAKGGNTGGYKVAQVFGINMNQIFTAFRHKGVHKKYFDIINRQMTFSFFPVTIGGLRKNAGNFHEEDYYKTLYPVYKEYVNFWLFTVPVIKLPVQVAKWWIRLIRNMQNIMKYTNIITDRFFKVQLRVK